MESCGRAATNTKAVGLRGAAGKVSVDAHWQVASDVGGQGRTAVELDWEINANVQSGEARDAETISAGATCNTTATDQVAGSLGEAGVVVHTIAQIGVWDDADGIGHSWRSKPD